MGATAEPKTVKNRMRVDIRLRDEAHLDELLQLGATVIAQHDSWLVLADPEGSKFCASQPTEERTATTLRNTHLRRWLRPQWDRGLGRTETACVLVPVAGGGALPGHGATDVDAKAASEHGGGQLDGELGHSSVQITSKIYTALFNAAKAKLATMAEALVWKDRAAGTSPVLC